MRSFPSAAAIAAPVATRMQDAIELTKLRLLAMVGVVTASGYYLGAGERFSWLELFGVLFGMIGIGAGGSAFNQILEIDIDQRMQRTAERPMPAGRVLPNHALAIGTWSAALGACWMLWTCGPVPVSLALFAMALYVGVYTPMKTRTTLNTWIGAVPGALPVAVGYYAGAGAGADLSSAFVPALVLFGLLYLWQIPHFFAIAWLYREQYAAASLRMLPCYDASGRLTGDHAVLHALLLVPLSAVPYGIGMSVLASAVVGALCSLLYLASAVHFRRRRDDPAARTLLRASLVYLPALFLALVLGASR